MIRRGSTLISFLFLASCAGLPTTGGLYDRGVASWYGAQHHGNKTANGERFDMNALTAAHRKLPFGTELCVRSVANHREVNVRINDRGPYAKNRILDLSRAAGAKLEMLNSGEASVEIYISRCP